MRPFCATCLLQKKNFCGALAKSICGPSDIRKTFGGANADDTIYRRGEASEDVYVLCHGWAAAAAVLPDGRRQIVSILLAGDLFSSQMIFREALDVSVDALTRVRFSRIRRADITAKLAADWSVLQAVAHICIAESRSAENLIIDLGRRTADERIAHLFVSLSKRLRERVSIRDERYPFPLRQRDIADCTGLTPVHVSRVITRFRNARLIEQSGGVLTILNMRELERIGGPP